MNLLKINNADCFCGDNYYQSCFVNIIECMAMCNVLNVNVFIVWNNTVYYRKQSIKECVFNSIYYDKADMYILLDKDYTTLEDDERVNIYTKGICNKKIKTNLTHNKNTLIEYLENNSKTIWIYQHNSNLLKFIEKNEKITNNFYFNFNPHDLDWSLNSPTFVKSRVLKNSQLSILLPLEDLYIPNYFINTLNEDVPFFSKKKTCVWRGTNSGSFYNCDRNGKPSRKDLILKYGKNEKYNIGLCDARYKNDSVNAPNFDVEEYVKKNLSIKEQLEYMFIISVEGNDFATNLSWIMLSNSVPVMCDCFIETWKCESKLIPFVHYIPLKNDFSDLDEKMEWALNNLDKCYEIAFMSKMYILQFFDNEKEDKMIKEVLNMYKNNIENEEQQMIIIDENDKIIDTNIIEKPEQDLANEYIHEDDIVLELGARYGSVSCTINSKLKNKTNQVVVEPDSRVWNALEINKNRNNCNFNIVKGFISNKKLDLVNLDVWYNGYGSTAIENNETNIASFTLNEIKQKYKLNFNVLVADCEGFLEEFFDENPDFYDNLRLIIFEADYPDKCNYKKIENNLITNNFINLLHGHQNVWIKNNNKMIDMEGTEC